MTIAVDLGRKATKQTHPAHRHRDSDELCMAFNSSSLPIETATEISL